MDALTRYKAIVKAVAAYKAILAQIDEERFTTTPPNGGWSFSEVYSHIFDSSLLSVMAMQKAANGNGEERKTHFAVKLILMFGKFPPGRKYKVPKQLAERVKKIDLMNASHLIASFELQLAKTLPALANANPKIKIKHPRLGYLNASQWLRFIAIHLDHHLKQIDRIKKSFGNNTYL